MNERMKVAQEVDIGKGREVALVALRSRAEPGFKKNSQGRAGCDLPRCASLQSTSGTQAPGLPSQLETEESELQKKKKKKKTKISRPILHAPAHTHMRAVEGLLQPCLER